MRVRFLDNNGNERILFVEDVIKFRSEKYKLVYDLVMYSYSSGLKITILGIQACECVNDAINSLFENGYLDLLDSPFMGIQKVVESIRG